MLKAAVSRAEARLDERFKWRASVSIGSVAARWPFEIRGLNDGRCDAWVDRMKANFCVIGDL